MDGKQIVMMFRIRNKYMIKSGILFFISMISLINISGQKRTLDAYFIDIQTDNKEIIQFSEQLRDLPPGDPENLRKGVEYFLKLPDSIKDTALLILIYHQRAYFYFEGENEYEYSYFFDDSGSPNQDRIKMFCAKYKQFGFKLSIISDGDIISKPIPGFLEEKIKDSISEELRNFLNCYTHSEILDELFFSDEYKDYQKELGNYVILLENYLNKYSFIEKYIKTEYCNSLISFLFRNNYLAEMYGYKGFHIIDPEYEKIFTGFIQKYPSCKTTSVISKISNYIKDFNPDQVLLLYNLLSPEEDTDNEEYNCKTDDFNYDKIENKIDEIIQCIKTKY